MSHEHAKGSLIDPTARLLSFAGHDPKLGRDVFLGPGAVVIGRVTLGDDVSIWCNVVLRGDIHTIEIGEGTNIQDNSTVHVTSETGPVKVGRRVTVGHGVILHACTVEDGCLIGMGATILDGAVIGAGSLVGAGALVTPGKLFPPNSMILGSPAKLVRPLTDQEREGIVVNTKHYIDIKEQYRR